MGKGGATAGGLKEELTASPLGPAGPAGPGGPSTPCREPEGPSAGREPASRHTNRKFSIRVSRRLTVHEHGRTWDSVNA